MATTSLFILYALLFVIAFLYASVGHGGASGYLALMALFAVSPQVMKPTALLLNLFVSLISFIQYYRGGHFNKKLFIPLALASVPMAFVGGLISIDAFWYKKLLGILLLLPIARFTFFNKQKTSTIQPANTLLCWIIGGSIGLVSGLIGIGGGIILSPLLLLLHWSNLKETAAISALFIFVNSLSGLAGQLSKGIQFNEQMVVWVIIAFAGGTLGAFYGAQKFNNTLLKNILSGVLLLAVYKLLFTTA